MNQCSPAIFRRWFQYEKESHAKVLISLQNVDEEPQKTPEFQKALTLMAHMILARWLWFSRLGGTVPPFAVPTNSEDFFPTDISLEQLADRLAEMAEAWDEYLSRLDEAELSRFIQYQSLDGRNFRNSVEDILTQLFGHSWYHRGQIALLIRSLGAKPAATDFVFWSRELIH